MATIQNTGRVAHVIGARPALAAEKSLFEVAGHTIENVTRFKLLGHTIDSGSTSAFVNARIASATGQYHK